MSSEPPPACAAACTAAAAGCRLPLLLLGALRSRELLKCAVDALMPFGRRVQHLLMSIVGQIMFYKQRINASLHGFSTDSDALKLN